MDEPTDTDRRALVRDAIARFLSDPENSDNFYAHQVEDSPLTYCIDGDMDVDLLTEAVLNTLDERQRNDTGNHLCTTGH